jgi:hypothetical protein
LDKKIIVVLNNEFEIISQLDIDESSSSSSSSLSKKIVNLSAVSEIIEIDLKKLKKSYLQLSKKIPYNWLPPAWKYTHLFCEYNLKTETVGIAMAANLKHKNDKTWCAIEQMVSRGEFFL